MANVSVVIPTLNEQDTIRLITERIDQTLRKANIGYEILFVDDHSEDRTQDEILECTRDYPVKLIIKDGARGKARSLLQGFRHAQYPFICILDGDLQYPPEYIPDMIRKIENGVDIVVSNRRERQTSTVRKLVSSTFRFIFAKVLHGLDYDVQSGLKVFKREIIHRIHIDPTPWTFDLDFLVNARNAGYTIDSVDIPFSERKHGQTKVALLKTSYEIGKGAIKTKFKDHDVSLLDEKIREEKGYGFHFKGKEYIPHTKLHPKESAIYSLTMKQKAYLLGLSVILLFSFILNWHTTLIALIALITIVYFLDFLFNFYLITKGFLSTHEWKITKDEFNQVNSTQWPYYTIFCPLYKESAVLPQFIEAIDNLDYPKDKLQVLLLLEEDDTETQDAAYAMNLPSHFEVVVVPHSLPKTKPKACNYGLAFAKGDYCVIYDAEDVPDPDQLKKVVIAFSKASERIGCIQAKLNFYNPHQNMLTRLFTSEYSLWFELVLTGLQSIDAPIPLGGTSNHFRTQLLRSVNGWDAFNVTEDCDLGMRLAKKGYRTAMIDSSTLEEANSMTKNWFNQRTRWIKGYIQTYLVHMRDIKPFIESDNKLLFPAFQIVVGGKILSMYINPLMWFITFTYFAFRTTVGGFIESLYLTPILYMGVFSFIFGNFVYLYNYMLGCAKRGRYELVKYTFFVPIYWIMMSAAAWVALYRLVKNPYHWSKTIHGLHLQKKEEMNKKREPQSTLLPPLAISYENR